MIAHCAQLYFISDIRLVAAPVAQARAVSPILVRGGFTASQQQRPGAEKPNGSRSAPAPIAGEIALEGQISVANLQHSREIALLTLDFGCCILTYSLLPESGLWSIAACGTDPSGGAGRWGQRALRRCLAFGI